MLFRSSSRIRVNNVKKGIIEINTEFSKNNGQSKSDTFTLSSLNVYENENYIVETSKNENSDYSRELFIWTVDFHNKVNERLDKPILSDEGIRDLYEELTKSADDNGEEYLSTLNTGECVGEDCEN